jgi:hypothetical protein
VRTHRDRIDELIVLIRRAVADVQRSESAR